MASRSASGTAMRIGQLAARAGVSVETIRYYERRGLIEQPQRPAQGYRHYPVAALERLQFIKRAQVLGFSLDEIAELLALGHSGCEQAAGLARRRLADIRERMASLQCMEAVLQTLVSRCEQNTAPAGCPIVATLLDDPPA